VVQEGENPRRSEWWRGYDVLGMFVWLWGELDGIVGSGLVYEVVMLELERLLSQELMRECHGVL
jgi:hypothetical protein